jgi:U32 family peptidase
MKSLDGQAITVAPGSPLHVWIPLDGPADGALLARVLTASPVSA